MTHPCAKCSRLIRWGLAFCFDCNVALGTKSVLVIGGVRQYPPHVTTH